MTDKLFHELDGDCVVMFSKGVYRQAKLYRRYDGKEHQLYAKWGSGYARLLSAGGTTVPCVTWLDIYMDSAQLKAGKLGAPVLAPRETGLTA